MKAIAQKEIIGESGIIRIEKGKEYEVEQIMQAGRFSSQIGVYIDEKVLAYKYDGSLFLPDVFAIQSAGRASKKIMD
jgi:hypothetical protein